MSQTQYKDLKIQKSSGQTTRFSISKLRRSLQRSGATPELVNHIVNKVRDDLYMGISSHEIYGRAYSLLRKEQPIYASKYRLKKAIFELGPTGFPFERFIGSILKHSGYEVSIGQILKGKCVTHEVDVVAHKNGQYIIAECKFRSDQSRKCNVQVPLYIHSRFNDIRNQHADEKQNGNAPNEGWVVTNNRFTLDATAYANCVGIKLLSWDYPKGQGLKDIIDKLGLYPLTVSTILSKAEKQQLLNLNLVLCRDVLEHDDLLDKIGISQKRKTRIITELQEITK